MKGFDYLAAFYAHKHEPDKFVAAVDSLLGTEDVSVRAIPFGCEVSSTDWLNGLVSGEKKVTCLYRKARLSAFRLDYKFTEKGQEQKDTGRFFVLQQVDDPKVSVAFSLEPTPFFRRALLPLLQGLYPRVMLTFVKHQTRGLGRRG